MFDGGDGVDTYAGNITTLCSYVSFPLGIFGVAPILLNSSGLLKVSLNMAGSGTPDLRERTRSRLAALDPAS
jgi:hypothetical protein